MLVVRRSWGWSSPRSWPRRSIGGAFAARNLDDRLAATRRGSPRPWSGCRGRCPRWRTPSTTPATTLETSSATLDGRRGRARAARRPAPSPSPTRSTSRSWAASRSPRASQNLARAGHDRSRASEGRAAALAANIDQNAADTADMAGRIRALRGRRRRAGDPRRRISTRWASSWTWCIGGIVLGGAADGVGRGRGGVPRVGRLAAAACAGRRRGPG